MIKGLQVCFASLNLCTIASSLESVRLNTFLMFSKGLLRKMEISFMDAIRRTIYTDLQLFVQGTLKDPIRRVTKRNPHGLALRYFLINYYFLLLSYNQVHHFWCTNNRHDTRGRTTHNLSHLSNLSQLMSLWTCRILLSVRETAADWMKGQEPAEDKKSKKKDKKVEEEVQTLTANVGPSSTQV